MGGKKPKNKGSAYERKIAEKLSDFFGVKFRRTPGSGNLDIKGDIRSEGSEDLKGPLKGWCLELKNQETIRIWDFIKQAKEEAVIENKPYWALIFTRNREDDYVCISLDRFLSLIKDSILFEE